MNAAAKRDTEGRRAEGAALISFFEAGTEVVVVGAFAPTDPVEWCPLSLG